MIYDNTYIKPYDEFIGCLTEEFIIEQLNKLDDTTKDLIANKIVELDKSNYYAKTYINILQQRIDKAIEYIEKSKLNQLDTYCKYLYINYDTGSIEHLDDLLDILRGKDNE